MYDPTNPDLDRILADGRPAIRCACGFLAVSDDQALNLQALNAHDCPTTYADETKAEAETDKHWYQYVFTLDGALVAFAVGYVLYLFFGK